MEEQVAQHLSMHPQADQWQRTREQGDEALKIAEGEGAEETRIKEMTETLARRCRRLEEQLCTGDGEAFGGDGEAFAVRLQRLGQVRMQCPRILCCRHTS
jgi:hypothetical protein